MVATVRIGSLKDVLKSAASKAKPQEVSPPKKIEPEITQQTTFKEINEALAREILKQYADELAKEKRMSLAAYLADPVLKCNENTLNFVVGSKSLKNELEDEWRFLLKQFHQKAFNPNCQISVNAVEVEEYKLFTPKQQFDALSKEFPILKDFESRFGLDFDL